jgi:hypothetical protein
MKSFKDFLTEATVKDNGKCNVKISGGNGTHTGLSFTTKSTFTGVTIDVKDSSGKSVISLDLLK